MGKDQDLLQAVKDQDVGALHRLISKLRPSKSKLIGSSKRLNVNFQDSDGMAALHQAALVGNVDIMKILIESNAAVDVKDNKGMRPLHYAAWQGKEEPVSLLLKWGASTNEPAIDGETPLHLACQHGHYDVVNLMLYHHGDPTLHNKHGKTPLDVACEFGRYRVVELLVGSRLCDHLLREKVMDLTDRHRTTCIHLAAKNGHVDIIKLLLQAGVDINWTTFQGTCLHEAALFGKIEVVKLLLDCGVDVNKPNSYDQTALDIVNKFTTSRAATELKQLLKDPRNQKKYRYESYAVVARAVKHFTNPYDPNALSFTEGEYINVLEKGSDGVWKGHLINEGCVSRAGYFPASTVVLVDKKTLPAGMPGWGRPVLPPHVAPDLIHRSHPSHYNHLRPNQQSGPLNHYNSIGQDESFPPPPSPLTVPRSPNRGSTGQQIMLDTNYTKPNAFKDADRDSGISPQQGYPPHGFPMYQTYSGQELSPTTPEHLSGEWYGLHLGERDARSASPCRDSPTGSNRNSAASSGSGGSYLGGGQYVNIQITAQHRLSGQSYESGVSSRQSYHSGSSSSLGSLDRLEESGYSSTVNVHELYQAGLPDGEVLRAWLADLHFEEYYDLFVQAGYDMPTISRMTPEDLTAIGVTKPAHRKRLKAEISKLHIHDGIPDYKPHDIGEWLRLLNLDSYYDILTSQGYENIDYVTDITWEDLEDIGIKKLGHQKKITLAIERLKRIQSGSRRLSSLERRSSQELLEPPSSYPTPKWLQGDHQPAPPSPGLPPHYSTLDFISSPGKPKRSPSGESLPTMGSLSAFPSLSGSKTNIVYQPDVVAIQVNRAPAPATAARSQSQGDEALLPVQNYNFQSSFHGPPHYGDQGKGDFSYDETDKGNSSDDTEATSTLKRPSAIVSPRISTRPKPIAKIIAKAKRTSRDVTSSIPGDIIKVDCPTLDNIETPGYSGTLGRKSSFSKPEPIYDTPSSEMSQSSPSLHHSPQPAQCSSAGSTPVGTPQHYSGGHGLTRAGSGTIGKKAPPPPPKRTNSIKYDGPGPYLERHAHNKPSLVNEEQAHQKPNQQQLQHPPHEKSPHPHRPYQLPQCKPASSSASSTYTSSTYTSSSSTPASVSATLSQNYVHNSHTSNISTSEVSSSHPVTLRERQPAMDSRGKDDGRRDSSSSDMSLPDAPLEYTPPQEEDFPPPPPPISAPTPTGYAATGSSNPLSEVIERLERSSNQSSTDSSGKGFSSKRNESSASLDSTKSVSSTDLNALPFANENVGTIKQRNPSSKPSIVTVSPSEESADKNVELNTSVFYDSANGQTTVAASSSAQPMAQVQPLQRDMTMKVLPQPPATHCSDNSTQGQSKDNPGDVLNDIGNMLQDLTDELDAMLEFELE